MSNQIYTYRHAAVQSIAPYRKHGQWVFDDEEMGLVAEAFVCGMSEIIDSVLEQSKIDPKSVADGFRLTFSACAFPNHTHSLEWVDQVGEGNTYVCHQTGQVGWLCPALFLYYTKAPKYLYCRADVIEDPR